MIGITGSQTPAFQQSPGNFIRRPQAFDDDRRICLKVEQWRPGAGPGAALPELIDEHPRLYVALGSHSLYLQPGAQQVDPFPDGAKPQLCGRFDTPSLMPPSSSDDFGEDLGVFLAKLFGPGLLGLGPLGLAGGVAALMAEGFLPYPDQGLTVTGTMDTAPDDQVSAAGSGKTIRPLGLNVPDAGADVEDWRSAQGVTVNGRRYDFLVDRATQVWWPADDGRGGFQGRWGQRVEADPLPRRSGMRFPQFWKMLLMAIADGKTTGLLP